MTRRSLSPEAEFLLCCLRGDVDTPAAGLETAASRLRDWDLLVRLALVHRVTPWLLRRISQAAHAAVPSEVRDALRAEAWTRTLLSLSMDRALQEALGVLAGAGVTAMVLKGPAVANLVYSDPGLRTYDDVDLLVSQQDRTTVASLLARLGYAVANDHGGPSAPQQGTSEHQLETLFVRPEPFGRLDVHFDHLQIGLRPNGLSSLWQRARPWHFQGAEALVPAYEDLLLALAVHLHRHGFSRLSWFKDIDLLLRRYGDTLDWHLLRRQAAAEGASSSLALCLRRVAKLLGTPLPDAAKELARRTPSVAAASLVWRESHLFRLDGHVNRGRRAVQFVPWEGMRGALPSLLFMGRRKDKLRAIWLRLRRGSRASSSPLPSQNHASSTSSQLE